MCQQVCILYQLRQESISSLTIPAKRDYDYKGDYPANIGVDETKNFAATEVLSFKVELNIRVYFT